jgi:hypothetical protein
MQYGKVRFLLAVIALAALVGGSAQAAPGGRTGGTGPATDCKDSDDNVVGVVTSYSPTYLWPPNHKMTTVTINYVDSDNDGDGISITISNVKHNQAADDGSDEINGSGNPSEGLDYSINGNSTASGTDGDNNPDLTISGAIRSERSGRVKAGRTYTITVTCTDDDQVGSANLCVFVPHDQGQHKTSACPTATTPLG